jgi:protein-tyrosine phosphatase
MIDIHSHILWGLDDGPQTEGESAAMLKAAEEAGTTDIIVTPHLNMKYAYDPEVVEERIKGISAATGIRIHRGCEFHLTFDNLERLLAAPRVYTLNATQYLLIEPPDAYIGAGTDKVFERLLFAGLVPIIAHPERNPALRAKPERLQSWVDGGCLLQLTTLSITGGFGSGAKTASMRLLERGMAHVVASDAHDAVHRSPRMDRAHSVVASEFGADAADLLFKTNPRCVLEGAPLAPRPEPIFRQGRRWYEFWKPARPATHS